MKDRIKALRTQAGLSQAEFGKKVRVSETYIWMLENGKRSPSERTIDDICREFGVNREWLVEGTGPMAAPELDETAALVSELLSEDNDPVYDLIKSIMRIYVDLDPDAKEVVKNIVRKLRDDEKKGE